jgi:hypothetical protein
MTMVQEILQLSEIFVETAGRKFKGAEVWSILPKLTSMMVSAKDANTNSTDESDEDAHLMSQLFYSVFIELYLVGNSR